MESFSRSEILSRQIALIGERADCRLADSHVLLFGLGGVGGSALEGLCRAGVGRITVVDCDVFSQSNLNRQILCNADAIGQKKTDVALRRIAEIAPLCRAQGLYVRVDAENAAQIIEQAKPDFICDAIDCVSAKLAIIEYAHTHHIGVISCMGTGNKLDPFAFSVAPIEKTTVCPLARVMRRELKNRSVTGIPVLYSTEEPHKLGERIPASVSYVPTVAGFMMAGYIIRRLADI